MLTDGTTITEWKAVDKQKLIEEIIAQVLEESPFVEASGYTIETMRRVLQERL